MRKGINIDLDKIDEVVIEAQKNAICVIPFQIEEGETWDATGKILLAFSYDSNVIKEYAVGSGVEIVDDILTWTFNPSEFSNKQVVFDFSFIRIAENKRDYKGKIVINKSLL